MTSPRDAVTATSRVVVVSGASTGIGQAIGAAFGSEGDRVVVGYHRDAEGAATTVAMIEAAGGQAVAVAGDLASVDDCRRLVDTAVTLYGRLDVMCAHAGVTASSPFLDATPEHVDGLMATNLRGTFFSAQAAARQFVLQGGGGRLILTSSVQGSRAIVEMAAYAMTKAGIEALARNLAVELGPHGITVNAVVPGPIANERNQQADPGYAERWARLLPVGRAGTGADVAALVVFLASDAATFITGTCLPVDGGWLATGQTP